jgi:hypothetical protein
MVVSRKVTAFWDILIRLHGAILQKAVISTFVAFTGWGLQILLFTWNGLRLTRVWEPLPPDFELNATC